MLFWKNWKFVWLLVISIIVIPVAALSVTLPPGDLLNDPEAMTGNFLEGTTETFKYQEFSVPPINVTSLDLEIIKDGTELVIEPYDTAIVRTTLDQGGMPIVVQHSREGVYRIWESPFDTLFGPELVYSGDT